MSKEERSLRFERLVMPHIDSAYRLARWLTYSGSDAEDIAQEAMLRAFRFIDTLRAENGKAWLMMIVRRVASDWRAKSKSEVHLDEEILEALPTDSASPETELLASADRMMVQAAIADLPEPYRIILLMREIEDMAYRDIAEAAGIPIGTVMSRLARARHMLRADILARIKGSG